MARTKKKAKIRFVKPPKGRKTMEWSAYQRLMPAKKDKIKECLDIGGTRRYWMGFGLVDEGPVQGDEIIITENGLMAVVE